ncbi:DUF317 domain-containing protein [Streptomyces sp. NPDC051561]|uniref:DUF317 domain-containing protein n=1 Tax=Streptomyces sp. NPDC051561 TaxID=3365658 RepID=UPI0037BE1B1F
MKSTSAQEMIAPHYLAGTGNPAWITVPLVLASSWTAAHPLLTPSNQLTSPNKRVTLRVDSDAAEQWWTFHRPAAYGRSSWTACFSPHTPVEIIAGFADALTAPIPMGRTPHPLEILAARWRKVPDRNGRTSSDRLARLEQDAPAGRGPGDWHAQVSTGPGPEDLLWHASMSGNTPKYMVAGFARALASRMAVPRPPDRVSPAARPHLKPNSARRVPDTESALKKRILRLAARQPTPLSRQPARPPASPGSARTR